MTEKAAYTGPWQIPWKRAKKDPSAPKRPMSAFLYFSQDHRGQLKEKNPTMRNTEISSILGKLWRDATDECRRPYVDRELCDRNKYKTVLADWKREDAVRKEELKKENERMKEETVARKEREGREREIELRDQMMEYGQHYPGQQVYGNVPAKQYYRTYYHPSQGGRCHVPDSPGGSAALVQDPYQTYMPGNFQVTNTMTVHNGSGSKSTTATTANNNNGNSSNSAPISNTSAYDPHLYTPSPYRNAHQEDLRTHNPHSYQQPVTPNTDRVPHNNVMHQLNLNHNLAQETMKQENSLHQKNLNHNQVVDEMDAIKQETQSGEEQDCLTIPFLRNMGPHKHTVRQQSQTLMQQQQQHLQQGQIKQEKEQEQHHQQEQQRHQQEHQHQQQQQLQTQTIPQLQQKQHQLQQRQQQQHHQQQQQQQHQQHQLQQQQQQQQLRQHQHQHHPLEYHGNELSQDFDYMPIPTNGGDRDPTNFQFMTDPFASALHE